MEVALNAELQQQLRDRLWQDDLAKMPRHLYPELSEAALYRLWLQDYEPLFAGNISVTADLLALFAPAAAADLKPRYLADAAGAWYALLVPRYNRQTRYRFCHVRYWWAAGRQQLQEMVQSIIEASTTVPFDWFKFRLGYGSTLAPPDFHPQAAIQHYVVAGRPVRKATTSISGKLDQFRLHMDQPDHYAGWWEQYRALLDEQEGLAPGLMEDWNDYDMAIRGLYQELGQLLQEGGGVSNLWQADQLIGHISWRPSTYREQLIQRCWHINNVIVKASQRRQGLGEFLHHLALKRMNLAAAPVVAGLITGGNEASLKTAAKLGRAIVDSYVIIPGVKHKGTIFTVEGRNRVFGD